MLARVTIRTPRLVDLDLDPVYAQNPLCIVFRSFIFTRCASPLREALRNDNDREPKREPPDETPLSGDSSFRGCFFNPAIRVAHRSRYFLLLFMLLTCFGSRRIIYDFRNTVTISWTLEERTKNGCREFDKSSPRKYLHRTRRDYRTLANGIA